MTTCTVLYSYREAVTEMARLQHKGYVTSIPKFDGRCWLVWYQTRAEWEAKNED